MRAALAEESSASAPGYLVLSIAQRSDTRFSNYTFVYRNRADNEIGHLRHTDIGLFNLFADDIMDSDKTGVVRVEELAPGDYELFNFAVVSGGYPGERHYGPSQAFSIPFSIHSRIQRERLGPAHQTVLDTEQRLALLRHVTHPEGNS